MLTRRNVLKTMGSAALALAGLGGYAFGYEPRKTIAVRRYAPQLPQWPEGFPVSIAVISDLHIGDPWTPMERLDEAIALTNALQADVIVVLGDFLRTRRRFSQSGNMDEVAARLTGLKAPLGTYFIQGNHDWWMDRQAMTRREGPTFVETALRKAGLNLIENRALRLEKDGRPFWLAGLADQIAFMHVGGGLNGREGLDDLGGTLAQITDDAPVVLLVHEPDIFVSVPERVALTLAGHTHGGQIRLFGFSPFVPSAFGNRFAYGHIVENGRHLIVSAGVGTSFMPVRLGIPPEVLHVQLGSKAGV